MNKHSCLKCKAPYEDAEIDDYYCPPCLEQKKLIAVETDKKIGSTAGQQPSGDLQAYDAAKKTRQGFPSAKDLGL